MSEPYDLAAEQAILATILVDGERLVDVQGRLTPSDFHRPGHRIAFETMLRMAERRTPIDLLTFKSTLEGDARAWETVGGVRYLNDITDGVPRSTNIEAYAVIVKDHAIRRRLQSAAQAASAAAADMDISAQDALQRAEAAIYEIAEREQRGDLRHASSIVAETWPVLERIMDTHRPVTGIPSGFVDLDRMTRGFQPGNLILVAARPAMGKTAFALNIAQHAATRTDAATTAIFSLEMSRQELMIRLLTAAGRLDAHRLMGGYLHQSEYAQLNEARDIADGSALWVDDTSSLGVLEIRGKARRLKQKRGLGLIIVDYLQLLSSDRRYDNRVVELGAMSRGLKQLAKELAVPIVALSQLSRAPEAREHGRPKLADLRESGALEQDADMVLLLYREEEYQKTPENAGVAEIIIAKHRNGPTGTVRLRWSKEQTRFDSWSAR